MTIDELQDRVLELNDQANAILATAEAEKRDLTDEEREKIDVLTAEHETLAKDIDRLERVQSNTEKLAESLGVKARAENPQDSGDTRPAPRASVIIRPEDRGKFGWRNFGEFACAVRVASNQGNQVDPRLIANAPTTVGTEGVGSDGGFAVPPDFREEIVQRIQGEESLLGRTDQQTSSSNTMTFPTDETTAWQTSGGIQSYWEGENSQLTQSKPALQDKTIRLNKLTTLVPVTDELLEDAPALSSYLKKKAPEKIGFKVNLALVQGTGVGQPQGILSSPCLVSVEKEGGQSADTVVFNNIIKMWSRMYGPYRNSAVWLINQDIEPQLLTMSFEGTSSSVPAYMPANGISDSPFSTLMGRPIIPTQACETLGDKGDIIFASLGEYLTVQKTTGLRAETSIHLWFDYDVTAFKFVLRVAGQPWLSSAISPRDGSNTLSSFVTLNERT